MAPRPLARSITFPATPPTSRLFEVETTLHGSCFACHHFINKEALRFQLDNFTRIECGHCKNTLFGLGGSSSHESLMSQLTEPRLEDGEKSAPTPFFCDEGRRIFTMSPSPTLGICEPASSRTARDANNTTKEEAVKDHAVSDPQSSKPPQFCNQAAEAYTPEPLKIYPPSAPAAKHESSAPDAQVHRPLIQYPVGIFKMGVKRVFALVGLDLKVNITIRKIRNSPEPATPYAELGQADPAKEETNCTAAPEPGGTDQLPTPPPDGAMGEFQEKGQLPVKTSEPPFNRPIRSSTAASKRSIDAVEGESSTEQAGARSKSQRRHAIRQALTEEAQAKCKCVRGCRCGRVVDSVRASMDSSVGANASSIWSNGSGVNMRGIGHYSRNLPSSEALGEVRRDSGQNFLYIPGSFTEEARTIERPLEPYDPGEGSSGFQRYTVNPNTQYSPWTPIRRPTSTYTDGTPLPPLQTVKSEERPEEDTEITPTQERH